MNNVVSLGAARADSQAGRMSILDSLHEQGAFYDVEVTPNLYPVVDERTGLTSYESTGKKTLVNGSNGQPISVMSEGYTVVQNRDVFTALDKQIAESGIDLTGAYTKVDVANNGGNVAVRYVFPAHSVDVGNGDKTSLMITAINSFNGSSSFVIYLGGFRGYCMNTQVFGTQIVSYKKQHCKGLSIDRAAEIIRSGIDVFCEEGEAWKTMSKTIVNAQTAYEALAEYGDVNIKDFPTFAEYVTYARQQAREPKMIRYMRIFESYVKEMGRTEFALFNALTHISTHGSASKKRAQAVSTFESRAKKTAKVAKKYLTAYQQAA